MRSGPDSLLEKTIANIATEIKDNQDQLAALQRVFSNDTAVAFSKKYESTDVRPLHGGNARGGCMNAVYEGLEVLHGLGNDFRREVYKASRAIEKKHGPVGRRGELGGSDYGNTAEERLGGRGNAVSAEEGQMGAFGRKGNPGQGAAKRARLVFLRHVCFWRIPFSDAGRGQY